MKVKDVKIGEVFRIDNTFARPKLKLKEGYVDIASQIIWICREEIDAEILTGMQIITVQRGWGITAEEFEKHKQKLIKKYIKEANE